MNFFKADTTGDKKQDVSDQEKLGRLESELSDIKQDQADLKVQMDDKDKTILKLQADVMTLEQKISLLKKEASVLPPVQKNSEDSSPPVLYKKARNLLIEDNFLNAAALFTEFLNRYPKDDLADNAAYWLGECHYSLGDFTKAIVAFKDLEAKYPKSEKVPDAILKLGYSYLSLNDSNRAHHYLTKVLKKYPFSPAAEKAQEKLKSFE